jgi:hypothetical protein
MLLQKADIIYFRNYVLEMAVADSHNRLQQKNMLLFFFPSQCYCHGCNHVVLDEKESGNKFELSRNSLLKSFFSLNE